jgi:hypothetical protein
MGERSLPASLVSMMVGLIVRAVALKSQSLDVFLCWFALFLSMFSTGSVYVSVCGSCMSWVGPCLRLFIPSFKLPAWPCVPEP